MAQLLLIVLNFFASGLVRNMLIGAGIGVATGAFMNTIINYLVNKALSSFPTSGDVLQLLGLAGIDVSISITVGALLMRASIQSLNLRLSKSS